MKRKPRSLALVALGLAVVLVTIECGSGDDPFMNPGAPPANPDSQPPSQSPVVHTIARYDRKESSP